MVMTMDTPLVMIKLDSTQNIHKDSVIPIGDDQECIVLFVLNDEDVMCERMEKRVLH